MNPIFIFPQSNLQENPERWERCDQNRRAALDDLQRTGQEQGYKEL